MLASWKKSYDKTEQHIKKQRHHFADRGLYSQSCGFSRSHVLMWELGHKEGCVQKNWCLQTVMLEKNFEGPLDSKEIKPVSHKRNQPWIVIGRTDAEAEAPILWPADARADSLEKTLIGGKDWGQEEKGVTEGEMMVEWHLCHTIHELEQTQEDSEGQGSLVFCIQFMESQRIGHDLTTEQQ